MPATQTVEFFAAPGQTVVAKLFAPASDTEIASVTATEATNRKGVYQAIYTDVPAATYRILALVGSIPVASWWVDLLLSTATFQSYEIPASVVTSGIYSAMPSAGWPNGSFGDRLLVTTTNQRTVSVTGANHIAADIHELQPGVITDADFAVGSTYAKLSSMIEDNGSGQFRFDTIALSMGAGGGGGTVNIVVEDRSITLE